MRWANFWKNMQSLYTERSYLKFNNYNVVMKPFCELMVQNIFPTVRALMADELMNTLHFNQTEVAEKMQITQPAISQYMSQARGKKAEIIKSNKNVFNLIKESSKRLAKASSYEAAFIMCDICKAIRKEGLICKLHRDMVPALKNCNVCFGKGTGCA